MWPSWWCVTGLLPKSRRLILTSNGAQINPRVAKLDKLRDLRASMAEAVERSRRSIEDIRNLEQLLRQNIERLKEIRRAQSEAEDRFAAKLRRLEN